jgi:hypothetical protein
MKQNHVPRTRSIYSIFDIYDATPCHGAVHGSFCVTTTILKRNQPENPAVTASSPEITGDAERGDGPFYLADESRFFVPAFPAANVVFKFGPEE